MNNFLLYLLKVNIIFTLLYLAYALWFKRFTYFKLNRFLLLLIIFISFSIPHLRISSDSNYEIIQSNFTFDGLVNHEPSAQSEATTFSEKTQYPVNKEINWFLIIYITGLSAFLVPLFLSFIQFRKLKIKASRITKNNTKIYVTEKNISPLSFLKSIYIPSPLYKSELRETIIKHELAHIKQWHTLDILLTEIISAILWINPILFSFKKAIRLNHEYLADNHTILRNIPLQNYLNDLQISTDFKWQFGIANTFKGSTLKKRIEMMLKRKTKKIAYLTYFTLIPLLILSVTLFAQKNKKINVNKVSTTSAIGTEKPFGYPVDTLNIGRISSHYGYRTEPISKTKHLHKGIDLMAKKGTPVKATAHGIVTTAKYSRYAYGNHIVINHLNGYETMFAHMDSLYVKENDVVIDKQIIGTVGNTGRSTGPHLHYEIRKDSVNINPYQMMIKE